MKVTQRGFIALISSVVISTILLGLALTAGASGALSRIDALNSEYKRVSLALAESCANTALLKIAQNYNYTPGAGETVSIGTDGQGRPETCTILAVSFPNGKGGVQNTAVITTQAQYPSSNGAFSKITISSTVQNPSFAVPARATVVVQTHVNNDDGGTKQAGDFIMSVTAGNPSPPGNFYGVETGQIVYIDPGAYSVNSSNDSTYAKTLTGACSGSLTAGEVANCTVTYDDIATTATLTVTANVINNNGGTKVPSDFQLMIDGVSSASGLPRTGLDPSISHTASAGATPPEYTASVWGTDCPPSGSISLLAGQKKTCTITYDDVPPPAPICVDTVMMLDRTGSMGGSDLTDERNAANNLLNLYAALTPLPKSSVGVFGAVGAGEPYNAAIVQALTTIYSSLTSAVNTNLASSGGYTNLASAIAVSQAEFTAHGTPGKGHVLILLSDGGTNRPTGTTAGATGFTVPSANAQNASGELWSNPINAYADGAGDASDPVSENDRHRFYNFNLPTVPSNATITGIEAKADGWATTATTVPTPASDENAPTSVISPNQWTNPTRAFVSDDSYATDSTNSHQQGYGNFNFSVPAGATITGIQVTTEAKMTGSGAPATFFSDGFGTGSTDSTFNEAPAWTEGGSGAEKRASGSGNDTPSPDGGRFAVVFDNGWICQTINASGMSNLQLSYYWRGDSDANSASDDGIVEYNTGNCGSGSGWSQLQNHDLQNDAAWSTQPAFALPTALDGTTFSLRYRASSNANEYFRVDGVKVTGVAVPNGSLSVALSSNGGGAYTATKSTALDAIESVDAPSGNNATDLWGRTWTPANFSNGNFVVRVTNTSGSGTVNLDQLLVTVNYTVPASAPVACTLAMDLSWNAGSNWTSEKTQTLTGTETTYTFGSPSDAWSGHTWTPGDFTNTNFRARVHASDPGSNCDNASVDHLDFLQMQVDYTVPSDPYELALQAADTAKQAGTQIFTIHFGDKGSGNSDINFLAKLANGTTPVSGHENGSANDLSDTPTSGSVGPLAPSATHAPQNWSNPTRAFSSDNSYTTSSTEAQEQGYSNFGLALPPGAQISGIQAQIEGKSSDSNGCELQTMLSWNGGTSYSSIDHGNNDLSSGDSTIIFGGSSSLWGHTWTPSDISDANFVLKFRFDDQSNSSCNNSTVSVDAVTVQVYYTGASPENSDNDNFYVSPTSADMQDIFQSIGEKVCPALTAPPPAPPPTTGTLIVITHVINDNGGTAQSSDFPITVTGLNPSPSTFPMPGEDAPGTAITLDPGAYSVSEDTSGLLYDSSIPPGLCSGTINAGEIKTCTIINDDLPPPTGSTATPVPPSSINIGSWTESP